MIVENVLPENYAEMLNVWENSVLNVWENSVRATHDFITEVKMREK